VAKQTKKQKHNATTKRVNTSIESVPPGNVKITTNSADAGNANILVASGNIDTVVKSETHDNARNAVDDAINNTGNGKIDAGNAVEATAASGNHDFDGANITGVINRNSTVETSFASVADAVMNANIHQDGVGAVDVLVEVSKTQAYIFLQVSNFVIFDDKLF
jgi:hypothetical protein